jgi:hypothetical protein
MIYTDDSKNDITQLIKKQELQQYEEWKKLYDDEILNQ